MAKGPAWRQAFDKAERAVTPRVEALTRTEEFAKSATVAVHASAFLRSQLTGVSARLWHLLNLPAGTDVARLRHQMGAMDRELRRLAMRIELAQELPDAGAEPGELEGGSSEQAP